MRPQYLRVRNWENFQHYKDRDPKWIKYHTSALRDYELTSLPPLTRLVYKELLLVAAVTDNNIPHDPEWIAEQIHLDRKSAAIGVENLVTAGFLTVSGAKRSASKAIAKKRDAASLEKKRKETEDKVKSKSSTKAVPVARDAGTASIFQIPTKAAS